MVGCGKRNAVQKMSLPFRGHPFFPSLPFSPKIHALPGGKTMRPSRALSVSSNRIITSNSAFSRASLYTCEVWNDNCSWVTQTEELCHNPGTVVPFTVPLRLSHGKRTSKFRACWAPGRDIEGALRRRWLVLVLVVMLPLIPALV